MPSLTIGLSNGRTISVSKVRLFPLTLLQQEAQCRALANAKLGPTSPGIGFIGSPGWVLGGALAMSALTAIASEGSRKEGAQLLQRAEALRNDALCAGKMVAIEAIEGIDSPAPHRWSAVIGIRKDVNVRNLNASQLAEFCAKHGINRTDVYEESMFSVKVKQPTWSVTDKVNYVYNDDPFMFVESATGAEHVRLSDISTYSFIGDNLPMI